MTFLAERLYSAAVNCAHGVWVGPTQDQAGDVQYVDASAKGVMLTPNALAAVDRCGRRRVACVSDLHEAWDRVKIPPADVLVVAGDILLLNRWHTYAEGARKVAQFREWCRAQPVDDVVVIGGNHDAVLAGMPYEAAKRLVEGVPGDGDVRITYLDNNSATIQGLEFFGTPFSRGHSENSAFQRRPCDEDLLSAIPRTTHVLVTHEPGHSGVRDLLEAVRPRLHVGGHIHCRYGARMLGGVLSVTACTVNGKYKPVNAPIVVDV